MGGQITHLMSKTEHALTPFFLCVPFNFIYTCPKCSFSKKNASHCIPRDCHIHSKLNLISVYLTMFL